MSPKITKQPSKGKSTAKTVNVRIDPTHHAKALTYARRKGITLSSVIQIALAEKLERAEKEGS